ncbi:MAG: hypothetical protein GY944_24510 [bacterium]|nr:hypothetical protein [bacterium]
MATEEVAMTEMIFEAELAGGVALYDASHLMPLPSGMWPRRPFGAFVNRVFVHHSGALGRPGLEGALNSARYVVKHRDFPCAAYHYWVPYETLSLDGYDYVVIRCAPDHARTFHTGGNANHLGVGVALQGNTTDRPLSKSHEECLEALLPLLTERHELYAGPPIISWHSEAMRFGALKNKAACPGKHAEEWLRKWRGDE